MGRKIENTLGRRVINSVQQQSGVEKKKKQKFDKDALIKKKWVQGEEYKITTL